MTRIAPKSPARKRAQKRVKKLKREFVDSMAVLHPEIERVYELPAVITTKDGREICQKNAAGKNEYAERTYKMFAAQGGLCGICTLLMSPDDVTFEHTDKRGGGRRNDTVFPYTNSRGQLVVNCAAHAKCNFELGSRRLK